MVSKRPIFSISPALFALAVGCSDAAAPATDSASSALTFPTTWNPVLQATGAMGDVTTDAQQDSRNIVGNAAFPAVFFANDGTSFFVRLRLQATPLGNNGNLKQFAWGLLFNTDGNFDKYEYSLLLDASGTPDQIKYAANQVFGQLGDPSDTAELLLASISVVTTAPNNNVEVIPADTCFDANLVNACTGANDPNRDFFLDFGVPLTTFALPAMPPPAPLDLTQPVQILAGSSSSGQNLSLDLGGCSVNGPNSLSQCASIPMLLTCGNGILEAGEGCDDGNVTAGDGCNAVCLVEESFACNATAPGKTGNASCATGVCDATGGAPGVCERPNVCGNGVLEAGEGCDDGGTAPGDGCSASCLVENGNACNATAPGSLGSASCASGLCDPTGGAPGVCEPTNVCGNGVREAGEGCDDGGTASGDGCSATCLVEDGGACNAVAPGNTGAASCASGICDTTGGGAGTCEPADTCGNGVREAGEGCDDGNTASGDGCSASCLVEDGLACNGVAPGNTGAASCASGICDTTSGGTGTCEPADTCGNGALEAGEGCDDGNTTAGDGCSAGCRIENGNACNATAPGNLGNASCVSGLCDISSGAPGVCEPTNACGNGLLEAGEGCDDGNTAAGDGCDASCLVETGNACNATAPGNIGSDSCASGICDVTGGGDGVCEPANTCGNGVREAGEGCDDGGTISGDGCSATCLIEDGLACNAAAPGNTGNASCASAICDLTEGGAGTCEPADSCGNGVLEPGEGCDDGNTVAGDGCSAACLVENGGACNAAAPGNIGDPSCASAICDLTEGGAGVCEPADTCGNGVLEAGEGCDDGGTTSGDGCSATCRIEDGLACNQVAPGSTGNASCASGICDPTSGGTGTCEPANSCGNGVLEAGEGCDDGGTASGDGCSATCRIEDGLACNQAAPGTIGDPSCESGVCDLTGGGTGVCEPANTCGNGVLEAGEGCDDGGNAPGDGCSAACLVEDGGACNDTLPGPIGGPSCASGVCDTTGGTGVCEPADTCGNGVLEAGEGCDDGGTDGGDGCNAQCLVEDGNACNAQTPGSIGNPSCASGVCDASGGAPGVCEPAGTCGNGVLEAGEGCDDGNTDGGDGCNASCRIEDGNACNATAPGSIGDPSCASGVCDDSRGAPGVCEPANTCGNGVLEAGEGCDDGNTSGGDGCNASCLVEDGNACNATAPGSIGDPSCASGVCDETNGATGTCEAANTCGNGVVEAGEGCDDGNTDGGDGCSAQCLIENGIACNAAMPGATGDASCESGLCDTTDGGAGVCMPPMNACTENCDQQLGVSGGGCDAGNRSSSGLAFGLVLGVAFVAGRRRRGALLAGSVAVVAVVGMGTRDAAAQAISTKYSAERFELSAHRDGLLGVDWADVRGHGVLDLGFWLGYANDPVNLYEMSSGDRVGSLVHNRFGGDLVVAARLGDRFELDFGAAVVLFQSDRVNPAIVGRDVAGGGLGDLRIGGKATLLRRGNTAVAAMASVGLPTNTGDYGGESGATFMPGLAVSHRQGAVRLAANLDYRIRGSEQILDLTVDDEVIFRVGLGYRFASSLELDGTADVATGANDMFGAFNRNHAELRGGASYDVTPVVRAFGAVGAGVAEGFGTPDWRMLVGARFGIEKKARVAPRPEPPRDTDGDGLIDTVDRCPTEPETKNGFEDTDGCPDDPDPDRDGILADADKCPTEPEDADGFEDTDGCPDPDNDHDGIADADDQCRDVAGVAEMKGCPDPDRDGDTVVDRLDNCPDEPGDPANHGCKAKQLVVINQTKIEVLESVYFKTDLDVIEKKSYALLDNVAAVLTAHPKLQIEVEGHTDNVGTAAHNKKLSQRRAEAVVKFLVKKGVDASRLRAVGYGADKPIADNTTKVGRAANRRVVFTILDAVDGVRSGNSGPGDDTIDR